MTDLNTARILSQEGDPQTILQLLAYLEDEAKWHTAMVPYLLMFFSATLKQNEEARQLIIEKISGYFEQKPIMPKYDTPRYQCFLALIDTIGVLRDSLVMPIIERQISRWKFDSDILQKALVTLAEIDADRAMLRLKEEMGLSEIRDISLFTSKMKVLSIKKPSADRLEFFTLGVWARDEFESRERGYPFKYENGLVYFMYGGTDKRFAGQAQSEEDAIRVATGYLAWWLWTCGAI